MTGTETNQTGKLVDQIVTELESQNPGAKQVTGLALSSAITNVAFLDKGLLPEQLPAGLSLLYDGFRSEPLRTYELKYILTQLYGTCALPAR